MRTTAHVCTVYGHPVLNLRAGAGRYTTKKTKRMKRMLSGGEMEHFGAHLRDEDFARFELERKKLAFERERSDADRAERERERE